MLDKYFAVGLLLAAINHLSPFERYAEEALSWVGGLTFLIIGCCYAYYKMKNGDDQ